MKRRLFAGLLVLTLLSTCIISGTFAKYVTQASADETARVAKFGVTAQITGDLFGETYGSDGKITSYDRNGGTVSAESTGTKVVAPGTQGNTMTFSVTGTPEVSTKVTFANAKTNTGADANMADSDIVLKSGDYGVMVMYNGTITKENSVGKYELTSNVFTKIASTPPATPSEVYELHDIAAVAADYYPITWTVSDASKTKIADVKTALGTALTKGTAYKPNENINNSATLTWAWDFGTAAAGTIGDVDRKDTILGQMIAGSPQVVVKKSDKYDVVSYADVPAASGKTPNVKVAYDATGSAPADATATGVLAVLTEAFNASLVVEQVD